MKVGEVYERVAGRQRDPRGRDWEPPGTRIQVEECGLAQSDSGIDQARAVFLSGPRRGEKVQWAERYITDTHRLESSE